jgi:hypothetical protein
VKFRGSDRPAAEHFLFSAILVDFAKVAEKKLAQTADPQVFSVTLWLQRSVMIQL